MLDTVWTIFVALGIGGILGWWLTTRFGLEITHKHRVIEEHTKKLHIYVEEYYINITSFAQFLGEQLKGILQKLSQGNKPTEEELGLSLFVYARLSKLEEEWIRKRAAILLLRDRTAEKILAELRGKFEDNFLGDGGCISREDDARLREKITPFELLSEFKRKMEDPELQSIARKYKRTIQSDIPRLRSLVGYLSCLYKLFDFEINTCYEAWYGGKNPKPNFVEEEWLLLRDTLKNMKTLGNITSKEYTKYWKRIGGTRHSLESDPLPLLSHIRNNYHNSFIQLLKRDT